MLPQRIGILTTGYFFASIQHPEGVLQKDQPLQATRIFGGGWAKRLLTLSQNEHLMHHLFPMVPYYRYHDAWRLSEPELKHQDLVWDSLLGARAMPALLKNILPVRIKKLEPAGQDILACTLTATDGNPLPDWTAGAHIDVHITDHTIRQYSLTGLAPAGQYSIAVKREANGRGGSRALHEQFREGQTITISRPRNLFPLATGHSHTTLIAGGIGITPLLAMARQLHAQQHAFDLHLCAGSAKRLPFAATLDNTAWASQVQRWISPNRITAEALPEWQPGQAIYLCGPNSFMEHIQQLAAARGWPQDAIHSEHFAAVADTADNAPFQVRLARSDKTFEVAANQSLLDALQAQQVPITASCSQGLCGTCRCTVLEGEVDHRDRFFNPDEHARGEIATCVSRGKTGVLVLDL